MQKWSVTIPESTYEVWAESEGEAIDLAIDELQHDNYVCAENLTEKETRKAIPLPDQTLDYYIKCMAADKLVNCDIYDGTIYITDGYRIYTTNKEAIESLTDTKAGITDTEMGEKLHATMEDPSFGTKDSYSIDKYAVDIQDIIKEIKKGKRTFSFSTKPFGCSHKVNSKYLLEAIYYTGSNIIFTVDAPNAFIRLNGKHKVTLLPIIKIGHGEDKGTETRNGEQRKA